MLSRLQTTLAKSLLSQNGSHFGSSANISKMLRRPFSHNPSQHKLPTFTSKDFEVRDTTLQFVPYEDDGITQVGKSSYTPEERMKFSSKIRGTFTSSDVQLSKYGIGQLLETAEIRVARGDPRPLDFLLQHGVQGKSPDGPVDVIDHRIANHKSSAVSCTFNLSAAAFFGAQSSYRPSYGKFAILGKGHFNILGIKLHGAEYNVFSPPDLSGTEAEATVASAINAKTIQAWRQCHLFSVNEIVCGPINVRKDLPEAEKAEWEKLLRFNK